MTIALLIAASIERLADLIRRRHAPLSFTIPSHTAATLPHLAGTLRIIEGTAWITTQGRAHVDGTDHVLTTGESIALQAADRAVIQSYRADRPVAITWSPATTQRATAAGSAPAIG